MIEIKNLTKSYGNHTVLEDISLEIPEGQIIGLFGENGVGKTSFMKSVLGFTGYSGQILIDGAPRSKSNIAKLSFATCEHSYFHNATPKDHAEFYKSQFPAFREKRFDALMEFFELPMNKAVDKFSVGQKNQFEVIMALSQGGKYIFMDEPFSGNDTFNREDFYKVLIGILEPEETIILATHLISEIQNYIDRTIIIKDCSILADVTADQLDDMNMSVLDFVKSKSGYEPDRVAKVLMSANGGL